MKKKLLALGTVAVMMAGMCVPAMAASNDPNMTVINNTPYSSSVEEGGSVTISVAPANSYYMASGFDDADDAANGVNYSFNAGGDLIDSISTSASWDDDLDVWGTALNIEVKDGVYGVASLHITNAYNSSAYIDMTLYIEPETVVSAATNVDVEVVDLRDVNPAMYEYRAGLDVEAAVLNAGNPFNGDTASAQKYPTAGDALYSLMDDGTISFVQAGGYVSSITDSTGNTVTEYTTADWTYYGWNYCVVRDGVRVAEGDIVSASVLPVQNNDDVYWAFGTWADAQAYFDMLVG